ncbi:hypothetical protein FBU59_001427 [Linderina macrospora]|uniref:Uncharacterized protein n=1 Tax=Linderina macrospora TaxID=4868 RepID=A0ACC1JEB3_9FUNG|nr:hypothetical protein FBU59_001427 [Linderina macrospora]
MSEQNAPSAFHFPTAEEIQAKVDEWTPKLVGKYIHDDLREEPNDLSGIAADQVVKVSTLPAPVRVIRPGMPVTRDFRPFRLNVSVDGSGLIKAVTFH